MAQTIALQRGTTTVTSNGTSSATLFTQSGGTATRVILNQLGVYYSSEPNEGSAFVVVYHNISGGQSLMLGLMRDTDRRRSNQFVPGASSENPFLGSATQTGTTTAVALNRAPTIGSSGTTGVGSSNANAVAIDYSSAATPRYASMPSNFYMGPGDSLSLKTYAILDGNPVTANITYSFTTITES